MDIQDLVKKELHKIHRSRNRLGYLPNIISVFLSLYFQREYLSIDLRWWLVIVLMVAGTFLRVVVNEFLSEEWEREVVWVRLLNHFAFTCISASWGLHFADIYLHYGRESTNVFYTLLVMVSFMTGASTTYVGDRVSFFIYVSVMSAIIGLTYFLDPSQAHSYVVINIAIYLIFSITNYRINTRQLCELLAAKITSTQEKENLKKIINTVPGFVLLIDRNLTCYMVNQPTAKRVPGIVGKTIGTIDRTSNWEEYLIQFMKSEKHSDISEQVSRRGGKEDHFLMNIQKMDDGGAIIVSIITNEIVEAKKKIREQEAKAQYSAKLASLGEMAAGIAHEVNNPLAIIQGTANILGQVVRKEPVDKEFVCELSDKIMQTSERISKTVRSLKALSRNGESDPMTSVLLQKVIGQCLDLSSQKFRSSEVKLLVEAHEGDIYVLGREVELSQVLLNLLVNAVDAVKDLSERWVKITVRTNKAFVDIFVTDSGHGIPVEIRDKIMNPFFTTKDVNQGTGLGLSISKNIISSHGGELGLLANEPHTTFRIRLPVEKLS